MTGTIEVIPRTILRDANGNEASPYGAHPPGYQPVTDGWTWRVTDHRGNVTVGLCRRPAQDYTEALNVAQQAAQRLKMEVINHA